MSVSSEPPPDGKRVGVVVAVVVVVVAVAVAVAASVVMVVVGGGSCRLFGCCVVCGVWLLFLAKCKSRLWLNCEL